MTASSRWRVVSPSLPSWPFFPAMAAFVSLYGLFADVGDAEKQIALLSGILPQDTLAFAADQMARFAAKSSGQLSFAFALSFLVSLWSANGAVKALFNGLNVAYEQDEKRGLVKLNLYSAGFHDRRAAVRRSRSVGPGGDAHRPRLCGIQQQAGVAQCIALAGAAGGGDRRPLAALSLRTQPPPRPLALDHLGWGHSGDAVARRLDAVLLVRGRVRPLRPDLRVAGRRGRLHDLDLDLSP